jgi:uncharacterized protein (DUF1501 family)
MLSSLESVLEAATVDTSGYKALVCVFLYGGNNAFNWVVPVSSGTYSMYSAARANLALAQGTLLPLNATASDGSTYGFHPSCPELQALFNAGHASILCNIGTLIQPTTTVQAQKHQVPLPPQLFSHSDQQTQWMTSYAQSGERFGWAGRWADMVAAQGLIPNLEWNLNVGGQNYFTEGKNTIPYALGSNGAPQLAVVNSSYRGNARKNASLDILAQASADPKLMVSEYAAIRKLSAAKVALVNNSLASVGDLATPFPNQPNDSGLGNQLHEVARMIKARTLIGDTRQIYFVSMGGYDTHNGELQSQQSLFLALSRHLNAFYNGMVELGVQNNVTVFTASDFGRTLGANADGSDHGWGSHALVLGGAVQGGQYVGTMPTLQISGPDDYAGNGRMTPTTSTDQYGATLARWFGVADADLPTLFPNLSNFPVKNLGFLG